MFSNYLLIGLRNAARNGLTSVINVGGLAIGVAGAITIFIFADQWFHVDDFHEHRDRIYEITNVVKREGQPVEMSDTPFPLGPMLQAEASGVEKMTRIEVSSGALRFGENVFQERIWFTDPAFFEIFTFSHVGVPSDALSQPGSIVITRPIAEKYFGAHDPVGKAMSVKFSNSAIREFTVTAVADLPENNTLNFQVILPMETFINLGLQDTYAWDYLTDATFVLLKPGQDIASLIPLLGKYRKLQNDSPADWPIEEFRYYDVPSLAAGSSHIESHMMGSGESQGVITMSVIAFLLLLLACFNYTNISVATVSTRVKEIGIRKVIGGRKSEIVQQFIVENLLMSVFAILAGLFIAYSVFMPGISSMVGYPIPFGFSSGKMMLLFFTALLIFVVVISGVYPAVYVSGFQPAQILKGKEKFGNRSVFSRALLTGQFVLAFMTIVGCFVFIDNSLYMRNRDWGYDHQQNIVVPVNTAAQYLQVRDRMALRKEVDRMAGSVHHIGSSAHRNVLEYADKKFEMLEFAVGQGYLETMNLRLLSGRTFDAAMPSDTVAAVVVNQKFVDAMGWAEPLNQFFQYDGRQRVVVGVVHDFHHDDFYMGIRPALFRLGAEKDFRFLALHVQSDQVKEMESLIRSNWKEIGPDDPYRGILQDDVFANFSRNSRNDMKIIISVAVVTLILACLGLYGLVAYNITRRMREFSVRKVFGANLLHIFRLMNRDYVWILGIAFVLGAPAGFFLMNLLIQAIYPDPQPAGVLPFAAAIGMMMLTVALTVASQMNRITRENPALTLRSE
ncbi:MAG: ABC transporter permease [Cyclobacteriaceae bacterium]|nr:ABC transporter permease [Cyclobacteriaceae bacterium]